GGRRGGLPLSRALGAGPAPAAPQRRGTAGQGADRPARRCTRSGRRAGAVRRSGRGRARPWSGHRSAGDGTGPACSRAVGGGGRAQRIVLTNACPLRRTAVASAIGSRGSRNGHRAQVGSVDTAVAASTAYGPRATNGNGGLNNRNRAAARDSGVLASCGR